jgi:DNA-binding NtrC family response regulator
VIAAPNKDLAREVEAGRFREDLYYRLSTVILHVPPLRDRREDILPIFEHFQYRFGQRYNSSPPDLDYSAKELLLRYRWPGNIRELRNVAEQTVVLLRGASISAEDLQPYLRGVNSPGGGLGLVPSGHRSSHEEDVTGARERELIYRALIELRGEVKELKEQISLLVNAARTNAPVSDPGRMLVVHEDRTPPNPYIEDAPFEFDAEPDDLASLIEDPAAPELPTLEDAERTLILSALKRFDNNRRQTAEALGISERTLYRKLKDIEEGQDA